MSVPYSPKSVRRLALLASVAGIMFAAPAATAQDAGYGEAAYSGEQIIVTAPNFHEEPGSVRGLPGKTTLSRNVPYDDLDLTTRDGARELRARVVATAREVCTELREAYPYREQPGEKCFQGAYRDALVRADAAIREARY